MKSQRHPLDRISIYIAIAAAILIFLGMVSCTRTEPPQPQPDWQPWEWSRCLPSASNADCPGEKPSWLIYQETGKITWTYEIDGPRRLVMINGEDWLVYDRLHCINAAGERVGLLRNTGFRSISYRPHPLTEELWTGDDEGPTSGTFTIYGVIGPDGQVAPQSW